MRWSQTVATSPARSVFCAEDLQCIQTRLQSLLVYNQYLRQAQVRRTFIGTCRCSSNISPPSHSQHHYAHKRSTHRDSAASALKLLHVLQTLGCIDRPSLSMASRWLRSASDKKMFEPRAASRAAACCSEPTTGQVLRLEEAIHHHLHAQTRMHSNIKAHDLNADLSIAVRCNASKQCLLLARPTHDVASGIPRLAAQKRLQERTGRGVCLSRLLAAQEGCACAECLLNRWGTRAACVHLDRAARRPVDRM
jgi:hypothetical protein